MHHISKFVIHFFMLFVGAGLAHANSSFENNAIAAFTFAKNELISPTSLGELQFIINKAHTEGASISLVGTDQSMGGQTTSDHTKSYRLSLAKLNKVISLDVRNSKVTVQAGMTWRELQMLIAPHGLAVRAMQSYNDFSIGGSLSVNVHGQDIADAPIIKTIKSFKLLCADGIIRTVSKSKHAELFGAAIGGYGLFGIIIEVTLHLACDTILHRHTATIPTDKLATFFEQTIKNNPLISFYSARFSLGSHELLDNAVVIYYTNSGIQSTTTFKPFSFHQGLPTKTFLSLTTQFNFLKNWRFFFEKKYLQSPALISRNNFLNDSICSLPRYAKYILQEYFIPYHTLNRFIKRMKTIFTQYDVNIINVSARHVPADRQSMLSYAPEDCCALVLYINIPERNHGYVACAQWTHNLINAALSCNGTYYLPYQLLGSDDQILRGYPRLPEFLSLKKQYDPQELFSNRLYERYKHLSDEL